MAGGADALSAGARDGRHRLHRAERGTRPGGSTLATWSTATPTGIQKAGSTRSSWRCPLTTAPASHGRQD